MMMSISSGLGKPGLFSGGRGVVMGNWMRVSERACAGCGSRMLDLWAG